MAHRIYPILGGLALGLAVFVPQPAATAMNGNPADYSGLNAGGLASREASGPPGAAIRPLRMAENGDNAGASARADLKQELERIRKENSGGESSFDPPLPVRRKTGQTETAAAAAVSSHETQHPAHPGDPQADRLTGKLLLLSFKGSQPSDSGSKAIHALLQSGLIAGVVFGRENIQSKAQLKELMKFLWPGSSNRPIFAIREIGSTADALPPVRDFGRWPSETDIASQGDPQYAYSTYRSLGASPAAFGFNMNLGPVMAVAGDGLDPASSFGANPLQAGVFAKTFILGHREENVIAVPIVDGSEHSVRALKTIAISDPGIPIASVLDKDREAPPFSAYDGFISGVRICLTGSDSANSSASAFKRGCDILAMNSATEAPGAVRDEVALAISQGIRDGVLTYDALNAAAQKVTELRSPNA